MRERWSVNCRKLHYFDMRKIVGIFVAIFLPMTAMASPVIDVLSDVDASLYNQIFILQDNEKIDTAIKLQSQLQDKLLLNEVLLQRYVSKTYHTKGQEVINWMDKYYDMPGADRMAKLANIKKVTVKKPKLPSSISGSE